MVLRIKLFSPHHTPPNTKPLLSTGKVVTKYSTNVENWYFRTSKFNSFSNNAITIAQYHSLWGLFTDFTKTWLSDCTLILSSCSYCYGKTIELTGFKLPVFRFDIVFLTTFSVLYLSHIPPEPRGDYPINTTKMFQLDGFWSRVFSLGSYFLYPLF